MSATTRHHKPARGRRRPGLPRPRLAWAGLLALLPIVLTALLAAVVSGERLYPSQDQAIVELETLEAGRYLELLGTYSRYQWNHPGPAVFYLLLPFHQLLGQSTAGMLTGVAMINLLAAATVIVAAARFGGARLGLWAGIVMGLFLASIGLPVIRDFWMPNIVILPVVALALLLGGLAAGRVWCLPGVAAVATFLCETNLSVAPTVLAMCVTGFAIFLLVRLTGFAGPAPAARGPAWAPYAAAVAIVGVMVAPPVYQELSNSPGNLTALWRFFRAPDPGHTLMEGVGSVAQAFSVLPRGGEAVLSSVRADAPAKALFLSAAALLASGALLAAWRRRVFAAALCALTLAGMAGAVLGITGIRGPIYNYLVFWLSSLAAIGWIAIGAAWGPELAALIRRNGPRRLAAAVAPALVAGLVVVTAVNVWSVTRLASPKTVAMYNSPEVERLSGAVRRYLAENRVEKSLVTIVHDDRWSATAGVVLQLAREDHPFSIDGQRLYTFGARHAPDGDEDGGLVFTNRASPLKRSELGPLRPLVAAGDTMIYARHDP